MDGLSWFRGALSTSVVEAPNVASFPSDLLGILLGNGAEPTRLSPDRAG
jgi:hypothetical protein